MRQIAPVSPALHLGADRVLIVGTGRQTLDAARARSNVYPSLAQIAGHALNSIFLDSLMVDIERLERINRTVKLIPPDKMTDSALQLRPVKVLFITPSQPLERIAARFIHELPATVRFILRPDRRAQPLGLEPGELPAVRGVVLPRADRPRLPGHHGARGRGAGVLRARRRKSPWLTSKPPQDPFEMFRRLWGPLGVPIPGMAMPTLDPQEVEKRIADLRSVEGWLTMNLNMVKLSIQGLEMQKATLQAMQPRKDK